MISNVRKEDDRDSRKLFRPPIGTRLIPYLIIFKTEVDGTYGYDTKQSLGLCDKSFLFSGKTGTLMRVFMLTMKMGKARS